MRPSAVRSGLIDQRDRATKRRRSRPGSLQTEVSESFDAWLKSWSTEITDIGRIDLEQFLRASGQFDVEAFERLRQLAIHLEPEATSLPGLSGWESLRRIYALAMDLAPAEATILESMSLSARWLGEGTAQEERLLAVSEDCGRKAVQLAPDDGHGYYVLGHAIYDQGRIEEALEAFVRALELKLDPSTAAWANLYKAHCLQDLELWAEALSAYDEVDRSEFTGSSSWRSDVLTEQRAYCLFRTGRKSPALEQLSRILDRYEAEPHLAYWAMSASFWQLIESGAPECLGRAERIDELAAQSQP